MTKIIEMNLSEEDYVKITGMIDGAIYTASIHGSWNKEEGDRILGQQPLLPPYKDLKNKEEYISEGSN